MRDCSEPASPSQCPVPVDLGSVDVEQADSPSFSVLDGSPVKVCRPWSLTWGPQTLNKCLESPGVYELDGKAAFIFTITDFAHFLPIWMETTNHSGIHSTCNKMCMITDIFPNFLQWERRVTILQLPDYASYEAHHYKLLKNLLMQKHIYQSVAAIFSIILIIIEF